MLMSRSCKVSFTTRYDTTMKLSITAKRQVTSYVALSTAPSSPLHPPQSVKYSRDSYAFNEAFPRRSWEA